MKMNLKDFSRLSLKTRRRLTVGAVSVLLAAGAAFGAAAAPAGRGAASRPATTQSKKDAAKAQYLKAKDLYEAGKYADAQVENNRALDLDPTNVDAATMKIVLDNKLTGTGGTSTGPTGKPGMLTSAQISMIRLLELGAGDTTVRGKIDRQTLEDFWSDVITKDDRADKSRQAHDAFLNPANFPAQVRAIRQATDPKYLEKVTVNSDPAVIVAFKSSTHTYALQNCATADCHGGEKGGNFRMITGPASPEQLYTNFYILSMYTNKDGRMLDRDNPDKSLLLQYSLPWTVAAAKHPKVDIHKMPNTRDARFQSMMDWIRSLALPRPDYGITFELPGAAATQPAH